MSEIKSKEVSIIRLDSVKLNPKNRNKHTDDQIERLAKLITFQGWRDPVVISNRSGLCVAGEGRVLAARKLGMEMIPAIYQDFDSEDQEIAFGISHNAIHNWSELDFSGINEDIVSVGPIDVDLFGIENFTIDPSEKIEKKEKANKERKCPSCGMVL